MTYGLQQQQQALLLALFQPLASASKTLAPHVRSNWERGLDVYKSNAQVLALRALQATYPVLAQLLGLESFTGLAHAFWNACPPQRGDMAQWGDALPDFIARSSQLQDEPYLCDVAFAEWALHQAASAADADTDASSFALMLSEDPVHICLRLAPGTCIISSRYPVASIMSAHMDGTPSLDEAGSRLRQGHGESALIWRHGYKPCLRLALPGEADLLNVLLAGDSLAKALAESSELDFNLWLTQAVNTGLLLAVLPINNKDTGTL